MVRVVPGRDGEVGAAYGKTVEARAAPLLGRDIHAPLSEGVAPTRRAHYTPTFVLVRGRVEPGRSESYSGEEFSMACCRNCWRASEASPRKKPKAMPGNKFLLTVAAASVTAVLTGAGRFDDAGALAEFTALKPDMAVELARAALAECRGRGYQVSVTVVDRFGLVQTAVRDRFAGSHTFATSQGKVWTAVSFRARAQDLRTRISGGEPSASVRGIPGALVPSGRASG
jgi:uncharacterized protein GlcG (DUF336 family)